MPKPAYEGAHSCQVKTGLNIDKQMTGKHS